MRLDRFLAETGIGSRSRAKQYIRKGLVTVNGALVKAPDFKVDEAADTVVCRGKTLVYEEFRYFLLNKPAGCVSATHDNLHPTVIDMLKGVNTRGLFPVGRLDIDTEGLLIITNDGTLAHRLLSPSHHVPKTYYAETDGLVCDDTIRLFEAGLDIGDENFTLPAKLHILSADAQSRSSSVELTITEGRFHQVKRMFEAVGMHVTYLRRIAMGSLRLDESLPPGSWRALSNDELAALRQ